ncbi:hypothetical protein OG453_19220 [Streptomyces sp. NBC_01381]|nr:hypothetical protein [Streptomyces sp. NBC_01381]MCX4668781.1 hypothetical protein [Streptomyces sp. NBC_01381]
MPAQAEDLLPHDGEEADETQDEREDHDDGRLDYHTRSKEPADR